MRDSLPSTQTHALSSSRPWWKQQQPGGRAFETPPSPAGSAFLSSAPAASCLPGKEAPRFRLKAVQPSFSQSLRPGDELSAQPSPAGSQPELHGEGGRGIFYFFFFFLANWSGARGKAFPRAPSRRLRDFGKLTSAARAQQTATRLWLVAAGEESDSGNSLRKAGLVPGCAWKPRGAPRSSSNLGSDSLAAPSSCWLRPKGFVRRREVRSKRRAGMGAALRAWRLPVSSHQAGQPAGS